MLSNIAFILTPNQECPCWAQSGTERWTGDDGYDAEQTSLRGIRHSIHWLWSRDWLLYNVIQLNRVFMHSTFLRYISHKCCVVTSGPDRPTHWPGLGAWRWPGPRAFGGTWRAHRAGAAFRFDVGRAPPIRFRWGARVLVSHKNVKATLQWPRTDRHTRTHTNKHSKSHSHTLTVHCKCCGEKC